MRIYIPYIYIEDNNDADDDDDNNRACALDMVEILFRVNNRVRGLHMSNDKSDRRSKWKWESGVPRCSYSNTTRVAYMCRYGTETRSGAHPGTDDDAMWCCGSSLHYIALRCIHVFAMHM